MSNDPELGVVHILLVTDTVLPGVLPEMELTLTVTPMPPKEEPPLTFDVPPVLDVEVPDDKLIAPPAPPDEDSKDTTTSLPALESSYLTSTEKASTVPKTPIYVLKIRLSLSPPDVCNLLGGLAR